MGPFETRDYDPDDAELMSAEEEDLTEDFEELLEEEYGEEY